MLAYRHLFHAGNFADVFKHALLARLLVALARKDKPFLYLDTHAGLRRYDLEHPWARKNAEWREGIALLWERRDTPELLAPYLEAVRAENPDGRLRYYPGSPQLARRLLRPGDRLVLNELNKADCAALGAAFRGERRATVLNLDGFDALKAQLPPRERRGLTLLDPAFDRAGEYARVAAALADAQRRFATGVYAVWYPLMEPHAVRAFERALAASGLRRVLAVELAVRPARWTANLRGCGLVLVNPPYGTEAEAAQITDWLWRALAPRGEGGAAQRWLVPE